MIIFMKEFNFTGNYQNMHACFFKVVVTGLKSIVRKAMSLVVEAQLQTLIVGVPVDSDIHYHIPDEVFIVNHYVFEKIRNRLDKYSHRSWN